MTSSADLNIELGGHLNESGITRFDVLTATGGITISGNLALTLVNDYTPAATDHMAIVTAGGQLSGLLDNVAPGSRLMTTDGTGSFIVNYGPGSAFGSNNVVVSNFQAVPEPAAAAILALLGTRALARQRRL